MLFIGFAYLYQLIFFKLFFSPRPNSFGLCLELGFCQREKIVREDKGKGGEHLLLNFLAFSIYLWKFYILQTFIKFNSSKKKFSEFFVRFQTKESEIHFPRIQVTWVVMKFFFSELSVFLKAPNI